ncbi:dihydroxyacetone kinase subunit L [Rhizobium tibeticum]|nr:dihydroxyacetone kinase subunit L [Rhizobium tibeticum]
MEAELNAADSRLGDGDTGTMLARLLSTIEAADLDKENFGDTFAAMALAAAESTGSSLGTLISAALFSMSRYCGSRSELPLVELSALLKTARDEMLALGRSRLDDKTIIDGLHAVATAIEGPTTQDEIARAADEAAKHAIWEFKGKPCRVGRARMWSEQSTKHDDPGMVALAGIVRAIASPYWEP